MVFCTAVAFASSEEGLLSVSGDCSMRTIPARKASSPQMFVVLLSVLMLIIAIISAFVSSRRTR